MLGNFTNVLASVKSGVDYYCGSNSDFVFDGKFPVIVHTIVTIIKIGVPILLIIIGMLDLGKAVMAQKEDEIKKGQALFIKRLVAAILVFLVVFIVQMIVKFISPEDNNDFRSCLNCFINGEAKTGKSETGCIKK